MRPRRPIWIPAEGRVTELEGELGTTTTSLMTANGDGDPRTGELGDANADVTRITGELGDANADVTRSRVSWATPGRGRDPAHGRADATPTRVT